ncbi:MAG: hypothetical protein ACYSU0_17145, partial [Planctomycetota bacterium]
MVGGQVMTGGVKASDAKVLYEEAGRNFRHFATWRRLILAGYFGAMAGLGSAFKWVMDDGSCPRFVLPVAGLVLTVLFWLLDLRNRRLIRIESVAAQALEPDCRGCYTGYKKHGEKPRKWDFWLTHTVI